MSNPSAQTAVRVAAPLVTLAVTRAGPRVLGAAYSLSTGRPAPTITSTRYSILTKVAWSMAVAGLVAATEAMIFQAIRDLDEKQGDPVATPQGQPASSPTFS